MNAGRTVNFGYETAQVLLDLSVAGDSTDYEPMLMLIRHYDGRREEAMLLSVAGNAMRVALSGRDDCTELRLYDGQWVTDTNRPVEIEFIAATAEEEWFRFVDALVGLDEIISAMSTAGSVPTSVA